MDSGYRFADYQAVSYTHLSVIAKTQEYGRLRVIGTTKKQIRRLVRKEGMFLSGIAIPAGLVLGCILGFLLVPVDQNGEWFFIDDLIAAFVGGVINVVVNAVQGSVANSYHCKINT